MIVCTSPCRIVVFLCVCAAAGTQSVLGQDRAVDTFVSDDIHAAVLLRPRQLLESAAFKAILKEAELEDLLNQGLQVVEQGTGIDPRTIIEIAVLLDQNFLRERAGIQPGNVDAGFRNRLRQLGLAFHNFHDVYGAFPGHDGHESPFKGNLSWRVHLLPFLEEAALYEQFEMREPWDSENNKALIEQMPEFFKSPGVDDVGKTCFHVFTGEGAPFEGDNSPSIREFTDGISNTILAALGQPDSAAVWTKPGGLDVDPAEATRALGLDKDAVQMLFADGSVRPIPRNVDPTVLQNIICVADGNLIPDELDRAAGRGRQVPAVVLRADAKIPQQKLVRQLLGTEDDAIRIAIKGQNTYAAEERKVVFVDDQIVVAGSQETVESLLKVSRAGKIQKYLQQHSRAEVVFATDLALIHQAVNGKVPDFAFAMMAGVIRSVRHVSGHVNLTNGGENQLFEFALVTGADNEAQTLSLMMQGLVQAGQAQLMSLMATGQLPVSEEMAQPLIELIQTVTVEQDKNTVFLRLQHPEKPDEFIASLGPVIRGLKDAVMQGRRKARAVQHRNSMKQILLAFHNYHDVYNSFPNHNGGPSVDEGNHGLSWRVHLLPFLDEAELYQQFDLDEPWDSEHNKPFIEQMPALFQVEGVEEPGHTSIHVFVGDDTPFNNETEGPPIADFTDGTSNTILTVEAGPETAQPWTKPGGIEFTGEGILKSLGTIGRKLLVGFADGSVRRVNADIDESTLLNLIRHHDGNVIDNF